MPYLNISLKWQIFVWRLYAWKLGLLNAANAWKCLEEKMPVWNYKSNLESWRTEEKYNSRWREGAIDIRIDCYFIPGVGWEVGCHVENHELVRLREEGGKVRGLLEGGRAPVASWPPATNEQPEHLLLKEHLGNFGHLGKFGNFWARRRMGCLSVLVLVASLLAAQVRFVTGCSIKGDMQCIKMFLFLQNFNNNFLPLLESSVLMIISTKILICVGSFGGKVMTVYPSYLFNWT